MQNETSRTWTVDVFISSHEMLRRGLIETGWVRYEVAASTWVDAQLTACQLACMYGMPTSAVIVDWPDDPFDPHNG